MLRGNHRAQHTRAPARLAGGEVLRTAWCCLIAGTLTMLPACITIPEHNPSYPADADEVNWRWAQMESQPVGLERPVVVLGGWHAPWLSTRYAAAQLRELTGAGPDQVTAMSYPFLIDIESAAAEVVRRIDRRWPSHDPDLTTEVDVVGVSMGGLVARLAATDRFAEGGPGRKRLRIRHLYTLGTPHRGASLAGLIAPDPAAWDMRPGSAFLRRLDEDLATAEYELVCYARAIDVWVGPSNTAPPGRNPIWVPGTFVLSHVTLPYDRRILLDIAARVRGEEPLADDATPVPTAPAASTDRTVHKGADALGARRVGTAGIAVDPQRLDER